MITLRFKDGTSKKYDTGISALDVVKDHFRKEESHAVAARLDGAPVDLSRTIVKDSDFDVITSDTPDGLEVIRHSSSHVMALAIKKFFPKARVTIGPAVEDGFYYDFDSLDMKEEDFSKIDDEMKKIIHEKLPFNRSVIRREDALKKFSEEPYKVEIIKDLEQGETLSVYQVGEFEDLCRGPHVPHTGKIGAIKVMKLAGAYWRGDSSNKMLTRVYGTSFPEKKQLQEYLARLEEAKKRDHKALGVKLDLFTFSELVGPGLPLWTPKGALVRSLLDDFVWELRQKRGYSKVEIPHITKKELYETSGHWDKFKDDLFRIKTREGHEFAMKPMNCPHHTQIYARKKWSYRELPQRYANTTVCYRDEQTGELAGLSRVRAFAQDDAHVFCRMSQVKEEFLKIWDVVHEFYPAFGFKLRVRLSLHDPKQPDKYLGGADKWAAAEGMLREIVESKKVDWFEGVGEAAFYGPKLDFMAKDALGRDWQVATIQLDMNMPERFDLTCVNEKSENERIVMIHAAIMGSIERFLSILIEHSEGKFPLWLNPVQVKVLPITDAHKDYAWSVADKMRKHGIRAEVDERSESTPRKVRDAQIERVNYIIVVGDKEVGDKSVNIRTRAGEVKGTVKADDFVRQLLSEIKDKVL